MNNDTRIVIYDTNNAKQLDRYYTNQNPRDRWFLVDYWNDIPPNTFRAVFLSTIAGAIAGIYTPGKEPQLSASSLVSNAFYCGTATLVHALITPIFKRFNDYYPVLSPESEWARSGISIIVPELIDIFANPAKTLYSRALEVFGFSTIRALFSTRNVEQPGWVWIKIFPRDLF